MLKRIVSIMLSVMLVSSCIGSEVMASDITNNHDIIEVCSDSGDEIELTESGNIADEKTYCGITWSIDGEGTLVATGTYSPNGKELYFPWRIGYWNEEQQYVYYPGQIKKAYIDIKGLTSTRYMFCDCENLTELDLSRLDTANVTDMYQMFYGCSSLTKLDVSGFDTTKVTDMSYMFYDCSSLTELDVSGLDTTNVTDMDSMFSGCSSLTKLDVSGFDTTNVTDMGGMFSGCSSLTKLDVSGFDTTNVTSMGGMFYGCSSLTELDVSGFDTTNVTYMGGMFSGCSSLTELDLSGFDTTNVTYIIRMFQGCSSLTELDLSGFDTTNVTDMYQMFYGCSSLTKLDVSGFDTTKVTDMSRMFYDCSSLTELDVSGFDTTKVTSMNSMFSDCSSLTELDVSGFDTMKVTEMRQMFSDCSSLKYLDLHSFDLKSNPVDYSVLSGCSNLVRIFTPKGRIWISLPTSGWINRETNESVDLIDGNESIIIVRKSDDIEQYIVTLDPTGGNFANGSRGYIVLSDGTIEIDVDKDEKIGGLPKPVQNNGCFIGWFTDSEGGEEFAKDSKQGVSSNTVLYAHWTDSHGSDEIRKKKEATCVNKGYSGDIYCERCGALKEKGEELPINDNHCHTKVINIKEATCIAEGYTGDTYCEDCEKIITTGDVTPTSSLHNSDVIIPAVPETCGKDGLSEGKKCSLCGKITIEQKTISANGIHAWVDNDKKPATCTEDGFEGGQHCKNCDATKGEIKPIKALGHDYEKEGTVTKKATLKSEGEKVYKCTKCGDVKKEVLPKLVLDGKEVVKSSEVKNEDGTVIIVEEHKDGTVTEKTELEVTVGESEKTKVELVVNKDSSDKTTGVEVKATGKSEFTPELIRAVKEMVAERTATPIKKVNPDITFVTKDASGNEYSITATSKDIKKNAKLSVFAIDPVTGEIILTSVEKVKCGRDGILKAPSLKGDKDYKLLSSKEASKALKAIKKTFVLKEKTGEAEVAGSYKIELASGYNPANLKNIEYTISPKKGSVDKATGVVTLDPRVTKGSVSVKVTIELVDGSKIKLTQKIKIKK